MALVQVIQLLSTLLWIFVPIRQSRTRLFLFFLILGLSDIIYIVLMLALEIESLTFYAFSAATLLYAALISISRRKRLLLFAFTITSAGIIVFFLPDQKIVFQIIIHLIVFALFTRLMILYFSENRKLLLFHFVLIVYEFSVLLKFFVYYHEIQVGIAYYYVTTALQLLLGIFFLFVNEKNSPKFRL